MPGRAHVVIVGGGVIGTSVAYHLTKLGFTDVVLLEQGQLSSGTTWHAAGLVGQLRASESATRLVQYSTQLYAELENETGLSAGYKRCGGVTVARTEDRMIQLRRTAASAEAFDMECELLSPEQALEHYPVMRVDDLVGAIWLPGDGKANPTDLTFALAKGARMRGARIHEKTRVLDVLSAAGRVIGVRTDAGDIEAEIVVNCAGQWAKQVGAMAGVNVPLHSAEHFYVVSERIDGVHPDLPILRDPDGYTYFKEEVGGLVIGGFEPEAKPWVSPDQIPYPFEFQLLDEDWEHFEILMNSALLRIPALESDGYQEVLQRSGELHARQPVHPRRGPRARKLLRRSGIQLRRHRHRGWCGPRAGGVDRQRRADRRSDGGRYPPVRAVQRQHQVAARPRRRGTGVALRDSLAEQGDDDCAAVPALAGAPPDRGRERQLRQQDGMGARQLLRPRPVIEPTIEYTWGKPNWLPWSAAEQSNTRTNVTVFDQTSFSKYILAGTDAEAALQWLCTADVGVPVGRSVYTGMLNQRGTYESDVTVTRTGADEFLIVSSAATDRTRQGPHPREPAAGRQRDVGRRDVGVRRIRRDGPAVPETSWRASPPPISPMRPSDSAPAGRSRLDMRRCARRASPTSANWVGSSMFPPNSQSVSTRI